MAFLKKHKNLIIIFIIYTISKLFLLLDINGLYIDDWYVYGNNKEQLISIFGAIGNSANAFFHFYLLKLPYTVLVYKIITYVFAFCCGLMLYNILKTIKYLNEEQIFYITLLFLICPLIQTRNIIILTAGRFFVLNFLLAFYLLTVYLIKKQSLILKTVIMLLFFVSFYFNSLLVFYAIPLFYMLYFSVLKNPGQSIINYVKSFFCQYWGFISLPIVFWIIKKIFFIQSGPFGQYNQVAFNIWFILSWPCVFITSFFEPISNAITSGMNWWYFLIFIPAVVIIITREFQFKDKPHNRLQGYLFIGLGILFFILGAFPYLAVGKLPITYDYDGRWQALLPLGFSFMLYFSITLMQISKRMYVLSLCILWFLISTFVIENLYNGYRYNLDWFYQVAMEEHFKKIDAIEKNTTFLIEVNLPDKLFFNRFILHYEHCGRLKKIFGDETRYMVGNAFKTEKDLIHKIERTYRLPFSNATEWRGYHKPVLLSVSLNHEFAVTNAVMVKLFYYNWVDQKKFRELASKLIKVKVVKSLPCQPRNRTINWIAWFVEQLKKIIAFTTRKEYTGTEDLYFN